MTSASACALALVSLALASACGTKAIGASDTGDSTIMTDGTSGATTAETAGPGASSTTGGVQPFRRFGFFHWEKLMVGYQNPADELLGWMNLEIRADGSLEQFILYCTSAPVTRTFTWEELGDGAIKVVPDEILPSGLFIWGADQVAAVTLSEGDGCDDVIEFIDYTDESGKMDITSRNVPGALCADGAEKPPDADPWFCGFTFVWCDGVAPGQCE